MENSLDTESLLERKSLQELKANIQQFIGMTGEFWKMENSLDTESLLERKSLQELKAKNSSEDALRRWRNLYLLVKNPKRRFRFTANLSKRYEAEAIRRSNQEKLRVAVLVSKAALRYVTNSRQHNSEEYAPLIPEQRSSSDPESFPDSEAAIINSSQHGSEKCDALIPQQRSDQESYCVSEAVCVITNSSHHGLEECAVLISEQRSDQDSYCVSDSMCVVTNSSEHDLEEGAPLISEQRSDPKSFPDSEAAFAVINSPQHGSEECPTSIPEQRSNQDSYCVSEATCVVTNSSQHESEECVVSIPEQRLVQESYHVSKAACAVINSSQHDSQECPVSISEQRPDEESYRVSEAACAFINSSQHGSEECVLSIPEERSDQESYLASTLTPNIHRQPRYEDEIYVLLVLKEMMKKICCVMFNKWLYRLLNVILEVVQVTFSELNDQRKISNSLCYRLIVITSSICMLISFGEYIMNAKRSRVVWQRRGMCCWFYYPGLNERLFGSFSLNFSVISSTIQFFFNLALLMLNKKFNGDLTALLLAIFVLISPMFHPSEETEVVDHVNDTNTADLAEELFDHVNDANTGELAEELVSGES